MTVLIALADIGSAMPLEEQLLAAGLPARWDAALADGPAGTEAPTVVVLDADRLGPRLGTIAAAWRDRSVVPGVLAIGQSTAAREQAPKARVTLVAPSARTTTIVEAIRETAKLRLAADMRWSVLRAACRLPQVSDSPAAWQSTLVAARSVDIEIPRAALRWYVHHYVTPTPRLDELREERLLTVPELQGAAAVDGTRTVKTHVEAGPLDPQATARLIWTLVSIGALELTPELRDVSSVPRRRLAELRAHLRARAARLENSTYYDVLEISPLAEYEQIEAAYQLVAMRYSPHALAGHDLAELAHLVQPAWDLVEKARAVLVDHAARGRYHDWLRKKRSALRTVWAIEPAAVRTAAEAFGRGQRALADGDVHRAMSELATACRNVPGHPDYEANLAWARYRVQLASGRDRVAGALAERAQLEPLLLGCKPWPRALVALALLCAASGDADTARWHLASALAIDPSVPAAAQLAQRL